MPRVNQNGRKVTPRGRRRAPIKAVPDLPNVDELLRDLPDGFIQCRSYNKHNLKPVALFRWGVNKDCICRISECTSCGTRKEDYYLENGEKLDSQYVYPEGYLITGYGKIPTDQIMRILLGRHEIADPRDLPNRVTSKMSNKGLQGLAEDSEKVSA